MKIVVNFRRPAPKKSHFGWGKGCRGGGCPENVEAWRSLDCGFRAVLKVPGDVSIGILGEFEEFMRSEATDQSPVHGGDVLKEPVLHKEWLGHVIGLHEASRAKEFGVRVSVGLGQA
jgi:hypothetical protein